MIGLVPRQFTKMGKCGFISPCWVWTIIKKVLWCVCLGMWDNTKSRHFDPPPEEVQLWQHAQVLHQALHQGGHPPVFTHRGTFRFHTWVLAAKCLHEYGNLILFPTLQDCKYDLYAIVHHFGDLMGGHYTAQIKSFETSEWYDFNDDVVKMVMFMVSLSSFQSHKICPSSMTFTGILFLIS